MPAHDLRHLSEVGAYDVVRRQIADTLVERGRALEVREEDRQARQLEALVDVERAGPVHVTERLIRKHSPRREKGQAAVEQAMKIVVCGEERRQEPSLGPILDRNAARS